MSKGLSSKLAGQVGEFLVCAELGRRGLIATSFTGNVPEFDLIVADGSLKTLPVQVKTSRGYSWPTTASRWIDVTIDEAGEKQIDHGDSDISHPDLIYVCVLLAGPEADQVDRYFILLKRDIQVICARNYRAWMSKHDWKRPKNFRSLDNRYYVTDLEPFEDNWALFEKHLSPS
ncbi:hypothetical protein PHACT_07530 [Pseudohongiella acticola]|uniref:Aspartate ammonia-lyase n=1 Tax=Pseudohongiella acticola TaxID=1524254 RepID=A0A1E8CL74_9GAMM|nr:hypothetical protein PHACT_07530 [Pseudohongiella acticola]